MSNPASSPSPRPITWNETSDSGPGALENLLVWRGRGNNEINLSAMPDDQGKWQLGETTAASPGVAGFNNKTWIAWTGTHDQFGPDFGRLNVTNTEDPKKLQRSLYPTRLLILDLPWRLSMGSSICHGWALMVFSM